MAHSTTVRPSGDSKGWIARSTAGQPPLHFVAVRAAHRLDSRPVPTIPGLLDGLAGYCCPHRPDVSVEPLTRRANLVHRTHEGEHSPLNRARSPARRPASLPWPLPPPSGPRQRSRRPRRHPNSANTSRSGEPIRAALIAHDEWERCTARPSPVGTKGAGSPRPSFRGRGQRGANRWKGRALRVEGPRKSRFGRRSGTGGASVPRRRR